MLATADWMVHGNTRCPLDALGVLHAYLAVLGYLMATTSVYEPHVHRVRTASGTPSKNVPHPLHQLCIRILLQTQQLICRHGVTAWPLWIMHALRGNRWQQLLLPDASSAGQRHIHAHMFQEMVQSLSKSVDSSTTSGGQSKTRIEGVRYRGDCLHVVGTVCRAKNRRGWMNRRYNDAITSRKEAVWVSLRGG